MLNFIHFPPICVNQKKSEKIYFTIYFGQERIFTCQIMSVLLSWKLIRKTWNECAAGNCKKEPSVGWPMDQGWDNIRKVSRPFPMSPFFFFSMSPFDYSSFSIFDFSLVHCWHYFICIFHPYLFHATGLLKLLEFTVIHRFGDRP